MTVKTDYSRFQIHDVLTAPEASVPILEGAGRAGEIPKFVGVLAGAPAALRAYTRLRHELRSSALPRPTRERIALGAAARRGDPYSISHHERTARMAGLGLDEIARAHEFESEDEKEQALLSFVSELLGADGRPAAYLGEEAREAGWADEEILEAVAIAALSEFQSLVANAAALPQDRIDEASLAAV